MERSDGAAVCKHLVRTLGVRVPIIAVTANCDPWNLPTYRMAGFLGVIGKPFRKTDLESMMHWLVESGAIEAGLRSEQRWQTASKDATAAQMPRFSDVYGEAMRHPSLWGKVPVKSDSQSQPSPSEPLEMATARKGAHATSTSLMGSTRTSSPMQSAIPAH